MRIALFFVVGLVLNQDGWEDRPRLGFEPGLKGWEDRSRFGKEPGLKGWEDRPR